MFQEAYQFKKNTNNVHSHQIVGSNNIQSMQQDGQDKDLKKKLYQDELQRQIKERDEIRKRENDGAPARRAGSLARQSDSNVSASTVSNVTGFFPWQSRANGGSIV